MRLGVHYFQTKPFRVQSSGPGFKCGLDDEHLLQHLDVVLCFTVCFLGHKPFKIWLENKTRVAFCKHMAIGIGGCPEMGITRFYDHFGRETYDKPLDAAASSD